MGGNKLNNKIIPTTELRRFYEHLKIFGSVTSLHMVKEFNASIRKQNLIKKMMEKSFTHFSLYNNVDEPFRGKANRTTLPKLTVGGYYKNTQEVVKEIKNRKSNGVVDDNNQVKVIYVDREIDPRRMTKAKYESGVSGKSSGIGGIDLIAWDKIKRSPFLGEIKTRTDKNAFLALIQVLTYFIEFSTENQIERCEKHSFFSVDDKKLKVNYKKFELGVVFADFNKNSKTQMQILNETKELAKYLKNCEYNNIPRFNIHFFNMTKPFDKFEIL